MIGLVRVFCLLTVASLTACVDPLREYDGPYPTQSDIVDEVAVVRDTTVGPDNGILAVVADRVRFTTSGDPHNVDRIVELNARDVNAAAMALRLAPGDTIRFSSRYQYTYLNGFVVPIPDWPGPRGVPYPVAYHLLTAISR